MYRISICLSLAWLGMVSISISKHVWPEIFRLVMIYFMLQKLDKASYFCAYVAMSLHFITDHSQQAIVKIAYHLRHMTWERKPDLENTCLF